MHLFDFRPQLPAHKKPQAETIDWLAWVHAQTQDAPSQETLGKLFRRFGGTNDRIAERHFEFPLYGVFSPEAAATFATPQNFPLSKRMNFFAETTDRQVKNFYADVGLPPELLIHVSCTGYVSPSAVQKLVSEKDWGRSTEILHAYHMGCSAAFPAVRSAFDHIARKPSSRVDIVHNELCTLHLDPRQHSPEQMVVQSLFADGHIRYSAQEKKPAVSAFEVVAVKERLVSNSADAMTWKVDENGFQMTLSRDVPERIRAALDEFLVDLEAEAKVTIDRTKATFAIHPGGPRLIDLLGDHLRLESWQTATSHQILKERGNMSSATLPHIWDRLLSEPAKSEWVVSLAFGPGLTIFGALMKRTGP